MKKKAMEKEKSKVKEKKLDFSWSKEVNEFKGILFHINKDINKLLDKLQVYNSVLDQLKSEGMSEESYEYYKDQFKLIENTLVNMLSYLSNIHNKINNL